MAIGGKPGNNGILRAFSGCMQTERIIGRHLGREKGPLFICLAGVHGNEPAGVRAIERFFRDLALLPDIPFRGAVLGLKGNLAALKAGKRFIGRDLNRMITPDIVGRISEMPKESLIEEYLELRELLDQVHEELERSRPQELILLDIHTTSADGGIFSIPADPVESQNLALHFHVPIVRGMARELEGTSLSYFTPKFRGFPCRAVAFEAGQNEDPASELRSVAVIINGLKAAGCISDTDFPNEWDHLLLEYASRLPAISELICIHQIHRGDGFVMKPGYRNFQTVQEGEHLADDKNGPVLAPAKGMILMPLYQRQGSNGFFLVREVTA